MKFSTSEEKEGAKQMKKTIRHPAKYSDAFIPIFADKLSGRKNVLDIFAGTCKIANIKDYGFKGKIYCNEIEAEWAEMGLGKVDSVNVGDAEHLPYKDDFFEAICTSPTYGNRMADHHEAKDGSKRNTYRHSLGRPLDEENTGKMQWGKKYKEKHKRIWVEAYRVLKPGGVLILNIKNHIRKGEEIDVAGWHKETLLSIGFELVEDIRVPVNGLGFGANADARVGHEEILIFKKTSN